MNTTPTHKLHAADSKYTDGYENERKNKKKNNKQTNMSTQ